MLVVFQIDWRAQEKEGQSLFRQLLGQGNLLIESFSSIWQLSDPSKDAYHRLGSK
jgi:hypothetical protein